MEGLRHGCRKSIKDADKRGRVWGSTTKKFLLPRLGIQIKVDIPQNPLLFTEAAESSLHSMIHILPKSNEYELFDRHELDP